MPNESHHVPEHGLLVVPYDSSSGLVIVLRTKEPRSKPDEYHKHLRRALQQLSKDQAALSPAKG